MCATCDNDSCSGCGPWKVPEGPQGTQGNQGANGNQGSQGDQGASGNVGPGNGEVVHFGGEQVIAKADGLSPITGATATLPAGDFLVWVEFDIYNLAVDTEGTYGIYLDNILQDTTRPFGTTDGADFVIHQYHKFAINDKITSTLNQVLTVKHVCAEGEVGIKNGSILYQRIT